MCSPDCLSRFFCLDKYPNNQCSNFETDIPDTCTDCCNNDHCNSPGHPLESCSNTCTPYSEACTFFGSTGANASFPFVCLKTASGQKATDNKPWTYASCEAHSCCNAENCFPPPVKDPCPLCTEVECTVLKDAVEHNPQGSCAGRGNPIFCLESVFGKISRSEYHKCGKSVYETFADHSKYANNFTDCTQCCNTTICDSYVNNKTCGEDLPFKCPPEDSSIRNVTVVNYCNFPIWVGAEGHPTPGYMGQVGGWKLEARGDRVEGKDVSTVQVPDTLYGGRFWARTNCRWETKAGWTKPHFVCDTGDCGTPTNDFGIACKGTGGIPPVTLAEMTLNPYHMTGINTDFYDDGTVDPNFNCLSTGCPLIDTKKCPDELTLTVPPSVNGTSLSYCMNICGAVNNKAHINSFKTTRPDIYKYLNDIASDPIKTARVCCNCWTGEDPAGCDAQTCAVLGGELLPNLLDEPEWMDPSFIERERHAELKHTVKDCCGCYNKKSLSCCSPYDASLGHYSHGGLCRLESMTKPFPSPEMAKYEYYEGLFRDQCPEAYSWQFDDGKATYQCQESSFEITFCNDLFNQENPQQQGTGANGPVQ
ncbi:hypothetical protein CYMTET_23764 [Cymbomonas tetramitiformis]|uniref:Uncharacterized protein n=1 Tax=Cymbomonas tetramitiformis TaxID=36881 RepID=A0AAE0FYM9_9CHLO|nr:hypothetical protein CYMTET_23764 [Cymbomonas tetramitiformis]